MNKNYYELLEIDKNASIEVIEKAYKALVKKYHPDLQTGSQKVEYEELLKKINEAYDTLSVPEKRKIYDLSIKQDTISKEEYNILQDELNKLKASKQQQANTQFQSNVKPNNTTSKITYNHTNNPNTKINQKQYIEEMQKAVNKAYHDAYIQDLKRRGFKIKHKKSKKDYLILFFSISIVIILFLILWQIPFVKNYFIDLYNNTIIKNIVNMFSNAFKTFK